MENNIDIIFHISDIHIRLLKRHAEYREIFANVCNDIQNRSKGKTSLIVITGDIFHSKLEMSPESIQMVSEFFNSCAKITKTIITLGNHDCNLNNRSRLDAISPIVDAINDDNLILWKDSAVYELGGLTFSNMAVTDQRSEYIFADDIATTNKKIALYHGIVVGDKLNDSFYQSSADMKDEDFDGFDMVLLGDIHTPMKLQKKSINKPEIWYAGSLVQNNYGEELIHGYLQWDISTCKAEFVRVENNFGYHTIEVIDSNYSIPSDISKNPRIRLKVSNTPAADIHKISTELRKNFSVQEIIVSNIDRGTKTHSISNRGTSADVRNVIIQNKLITDFVKSRHNVSNDILDKIEKLNKDANKLLSQNDTIRNVVWIPKRFEFSNMFSYGENNVVDFSKLKSVVGLFAPNASGKSSLIDSLMFCVFDKSSRAYKGSNVLNTNKISFNCKFNFEIDGVDFWIERKGYKTKQDTVKVDANFWTYGDDGSKISLNGADRDETNSNIRSYIGTYDDFVATAMSFQSNDDSFINKSQTERKNFLARFLDIGIFDELYDISSDKTKKINILLSEFKKQDLSTKLSSLELDYIQIQELCENITSEKVLIEQSEADLTQKLLVNAGLRMQTTANDLDIDELQESELRLSTLISNLQTKIELANKVTISNKESAVLINEKIKTIRESGIEQRYANFNKLNDEYDSLNRLLQLETIKIVDNRKILMDLESYKYDPNCKYCMDNVFVKRAIITKNELISDEENYANMKFKLDILRSSISNSESIRTEFDEYTRLIRELDSKKLLALKCASEEDNLRKSLSEVDASIKKIEIQIQNYNTNKSSIEHNKKLDIIISDLKSHISVVSANRKSLEIKLQDSITKSRIFKNEIDKLNDLIQTAYDMELDFEASQLYTQAISKDGVPYELIANIIPELQDEVNDILSQLVEFSIAFNLDGKNINAYISYGDTQRWPVELVSGMEKFITSLAIRCALLNISNLPRPTFLAVDEGFGVLDSDSISSVGYLFEYLKQKFDFILIVSHIDVMKDSVDSTLEISKDSDGFSHIRHE